MNEHLPFIWKEINSYFSKKLAPVSYEQWIGRATPLKLDHTGFYVSVPTMAHKKYWENTLWDDITQIVYNATNEAVDIKITIEDEASRRSSYSPSYQEGSREFISDKKTTSPYVDDSRLNSKYTFDNFIIGKGTQMAHAAALLVSERPATVYNPLFFYGGVGLGKTHLMHAIGNQFRQSNPDAKIKYVTSETFVNDFILSIQNKAQEEFREKYRSVDLLLVDDIQFFANKESTQEEFFHTFNELFNNQKQIVLTSDRQPTEIKDLQERLVSRFVSGLPVDITPPDLETRIAILAKKAEIIGLDITTDTLSYIAGHIDSNVRELEGALKRVQAYSVSIGEDITTDLAATALNNFVTNSKVHIISISDIQKEVASYYNISIEDLKGKKRTRTIVQPRQVAMYLARTLTNSSLPKIGSEFGGKDHTTVMHAYDKIIESIKDDTHLEKEIHQLTEKLKR